MKINELLNDYERLDEAGATTMGARLLSKLFGGAAEAGASAIGKGSKGRVIDALAGRIANGEKVAASDIAKYGKVSKEEAASMLAKAEKKAASNMRVDAFNKNIAGIGETASSVKTWTGKLIKIGLTGAYYWMLYEPLKDYLENIEEAERMLKAGELGKNGEADFEAYRRQQMSTLIGRWATLWATGKLVKLPFSIVGKLVGEFSPGLATGISTLGRAGQVYFMNQMNNPENATTIATWMSGPIASKFIGGAGVAAENKIRSWIPGAKDYEQTQATKPVAAADDAEKEVDGTEEPVDEPAQSNTDTPKTTKPDSANNAKVKMPWKPEEWEFYSTGIYRNKKTGELDYRDNYL